MGGDSAVTLCWFNGGTTDSKPKELNIFRSSTFIDKSHTHIIIQKLHIHLYFFSIFKTGKPYDGYACDDCSAINFDDAKDVNISTFFDHENYSCFVHLKEDDTIYC